MVISHDTFQESNFFCELGYCCVLIKSFLELYCKNDISNMFGYSFLNILHDKTFGDIGKNGVQKRLASPQNTRLAKAICFVFMADKLSGGLSVENLFKPNYCCSFPLIDASFLLKGYVGFKKSEKVSLVIKNKKIEERFVILNSKLCAIGNFFFLPNLSNLSGYKSFNLLTLFERKELFLHDFEMTIDDFTRLNCIEEEFFELKTIREALLQKLALVEDKNSQNLDLEDLFYGFICKIERLIDKRAEKLAFLLQEKLA